LRSALDTNDERALVARLFALLDDRHVAPDDALPDTGIGLERERRLAPAFIHWPEASYGTRCSTVLLGCVDAAGAWRVQMHERSHARDGRAMSMRSVTLDGWPHNGTQPRVEEEALS
jgi:uncharacterized protein with NRDE domain